jgi:AhpD family alkylhydroperoxidase
MTAHDSPESFRARRAAAQQRIEACDHLGIRRFLALDAGAYRSLEDKGGLPADVKELLGLVASTVLRCDDCINYHIEQAVRHGWTTRQIEDALNVAMVVGGSITIPHIRRALLMLDQFAAGTPGDAPPPSP